jgi:serine phosphatase RsbU (regulator of sigma subunit)
MTPTHQFDLQLACRKVKSLTAELLYVYEELALLYSLDAQLGKFVNEDKIAAIALREAMEVLRADCGWVVLWEEEGSRVPEPSRAGIALKTVEDINELVLESLRDRGQQQILSQCFRQEWQLQQEDAPVRLVACELSSAGTSQGYICLGRTEEGRTFTSVDQKLLYAVAARTGATLENVRLQKAELEKQRLEKELQLARSIQRSLEPQDLSIVEFLEAEGFSLPCYEIGGDYFDLIRLDEQRCLLVIADVAGKGPAAALKAAMLQGIVHAASRHSKNLSYLTETLNHCLRERTTDTSFVTAFLAILDCRGQLRYINSGHNAPLWIAVDGGITELSTGGLPLGILESPEYSEGCVRLDPGDLLVLYTDGVTDSEDARGETFGVERLLDWANHQARKTAAEVPHSLMYAVSRFCDGSRQFDDLTLFVTRFVGR